MADKITLVRHTEVARRWRGRCYGVTDVGLSRTGAAAIGLLAAQLAVHRPEWIVHSGLKRTRRLAKAVAQLVGCPLIADLAWRERDFGAWEGQSWNAIYRESGNAMDGMIEAPDTFRPGGGETTFELAERAAAAMSAVPQGCGLVVAHGGPIAALLGQERGLAPHEWLKLVPSAGSSVAFDRTRALKPPLPP